MSMYTIHHHRMVYMVLVVKKILEQVTLVNLVDTELMLLTLVLLLPVLYM